MKYPRAEHLATAAMTMLLAAPALAHPGHGEGLGLAGGLAHPFTGFDHLAVMIMVGVWAARLPMQARWLGPVSFVAAMVMGFALAQVGLGFGAEAVILASLLGLPLLILTARRVPLGLQFGLVALFGLAHGFAHGAEAGVASLGFALGMVIATLALHILGLAMAVRILIAAEPIGRREARLSKRR